MNRAACAQNALMTAESTAIAGYALLRGDRPGRELLRFDRQDDVRALEPHADDLRIIRQLVRERLQEHSTVDHDIPRVEHESFASRAGWLASVTCCRSSLAARARYARADRDSWRGLSAALQRCVQRLFRRAA